MEGTTVEVNTDHDIGAQLDEQAEKIQDFVDDVTGQFRFAQIAGATPQRSSFAPSGGVHSFARELDLHTPVQVVVLDLDGEEIASGYGEVASVSVSDVKDGDITVVERTHKIKLG